MPATAPIGLLDDTLDKLINIHLIGMAVEMILAILLQTKPAIDEEKTVSMVIAFKMENVEGLAGRIEIVFLNQNSTHSENADADTFLALGNNTDFETA